MLNKVARLSFKNKRLLISLLFVILNKGTSWHEMNSEYLGNHCMSNKPLHLHVMVKSNKITIFNIRVWLLYVDANNFLCKIAVTCRYQFRHLVITGVDFHTW